MMSIEAFNKLPLVSQLDQVLHGYKILAAGGCEHEFLQFASQVDEFRKRGYQTEIRAQELGEALTKAEAEKNALLIKLKHARRQVDLEIKQRQKAEQERDELDQQIMLVRDLLFTDVSGSPVPLNEEQQKKLDFLNSSRFTSPRGGRGLMQRRLHPIDETGSILSNYSDLSFDVTEDDLDATTLRNGKRLKRSRVAETKPHYVDEDIAMNKRHRYEMNSPGHNNSYQAAMGGDSNFYLKKDEQLRCTVDGPANVLVERLDKSFNRIGAHHGRRRPSREHRRRSAGLSSESDQIQSDVENFWPAAPEPKGQPLALTTPTKAAKSHDMQVKPCVIVKETCKPCGKRIQFGKRALKCADCRIVTHPECEYLIREYRCDPSQYSPSSGSVEKLNPSSLEDFIHSNETPQIPLIIYLTIREIDKRGMGEVGLYRIPGMLRAVRELKEKFLKGKSIPDLSKVQDVHTLCSLVKDFLRETLKEPIITFKLHPKFIEATNKEDDADLYQAISELPAPNRDTLCYILLHLQKIVDTPEIRMGVEAVAKAFGPSLVGFSTEEPDILEIQTSAIHQERILTRLLNLPGDYYENMMRNRMQSNVQLRDVMATPENKGSARSARSRRLGEKTQSTTSLKAPESSLLGPVGTSPRKTPSSSSLAERARKYLNGTPFGKGKRKENFFESPNLH